MGQEEAASEKELITHNTVNDGCHHPRAHGPTGSDNKCLFSSLLGCYSVITVAKLEAISSKISRSWSPSLAWR